MSMGRGRGRSNVPGQPPMQQQQQQQQQQMQQHQAAQDQGRRELRRPMQGVNPDDLARGMGRMDPFGNADYGNYGGGNGGGNSYGGHMMVPPPRPAPSADGWSSGENQYDVYDRQPHQQQQQQHHHQQQAGQDYMAAQQAAAAYAASQAAFNPQWNIGASEFVPKSNLSAAAAEFVPRVMARNTSQWGYQNQPQPQQQQQNYYQQPAQPVQSSYHQPAYRGSGGGSQVNPYLTGSGGSGASSLYNIEEQLSDSIATIVFMPSKLDRTATTMADKINSSANDLETLAGLANALIDRCFSEVSFQPLAGRFCATLAKNVTLNFEAGTMLSLLIERCQSLHASHLDWLSSDPDSAKFIVEFNAHLLYHLDVFGCRKVETLVDILFDMFNTLFTVGCGNPENLKTATDMLKICGRALENAEKRRNGDPNAPIDLIMSRPTPQVDQLMSVVAKFANDDEKFSESVRKEMKELLEARANNTWGTESCLPAMPAANEIVKPRSNAIVIEPDPNDLNTRGSSNVGGGTNNVVLSNNARNTRNSVLRGSEDLALTEEEMAFMNEHMAGNGSPGDSDLVGDRISMSGDDEDDMPDDIRAAYEVFLQEQEDQQRRNGRGGGGGGNQAS